MAHINLQMIYLAFVDRWPFGSETADPLNLLAEILLR
jgi:hypothetical protein